MTNFYLFSKRSFVAIKTVLHKNNRCSRRLKRSSICHSTDGFTLIELVIVITIIGILISIAVPSYSTIQRKAKEASLKSSMHALQLALENHALVTGSYPQSSGSVDGLMSALQSSQSVSTAPINPFTGQPFSVQDTSGKVTYTYDSVTNRYTLNAYGQGNTAIVAEITNY